MGKKSPPDPPDYTNLAVMQADASKENTNQNTYANRPNQVNPWGSITYDTKRIIDPATKKPVTQWTQNTTLDPQLDSALQDQLRVQAGRSDMAESLMGRSASEFATPMDWDQFSEYERAPQSSPSGGDLPNYSSGPTPGSYDQSGLPSFGSVDSSGLPQRPTLDNSDVPSASPQSLLRGLDYSGQPEVGDPNAIRDTVTDASYGRATNYLDPQFDQSAEAIESKLRNQGLRPGDEAYDTAMDNFGREKEAAYQQARREAILMGGQESDRTFNQNLARRQQGVNEVNTQGSFANSAGVAQYGMDSDARQAEISRNLSEAVFGNTTRNDSFQESLAKGSFANQVRGQSANENLAFGSQKFNENMQSTSMDNANRSRMYDEALRSNSTEFDQNLRGAEFNNNVRQSQIAEEMQRRGFTLNEINSILSGQQVSLPTFNDFNTASVSETPQYMRAGESQYNASLDKFNAGQAQLNSFMSGAGGMAGMFL